MRPLRALVVSALAVLLVGCAGRPQGAAAPAAVGPQPSAAAEPGPAPAKSVPPQPVFWVEAPIYGDPSPVQARVPRTGAVVEDAKARLLRPLLPAGPRRVAIQIGHLKVDEAPDEFPHLPEQTGGEWGDIRELDVNVSVGELVAGALRDRGIVVDVLPATIPPGYLADAFVALHADSGDEGTHGYKTASGFYRGPYDAVLQGKLDEEYSRATGMPWDDNVSPDMTDYYAFAWWRYEHALAPHTPAAIIEMGFISSEEDREILIQRPEIAALGITNAIVRFLDAAPRSALFGKDIVVPTVPSPPDASATPEVHNP